MSFAFADAASVNTGETKMFIIPLPVAMDAYTWYVYDGELPSRATNN